MFQSKHDVTLGLKEEKRLWDRRNGLAFKQAYCPCRGPELSFQYLHQEAMTNCNSSSKSSNSLFWVPYTLSIYIQTYTYMHKDNFLKKAIPPSLMFLRTASPLIFNTSNKIKPLTPNYSSKNYHHVTPDPFGGGGSLISL